MARGGYRPGAGRPKGAKNVKTIASEPVVARPAVTVAPERRREPIEYMLDVMNDPNADDARRDRMAIAAAPFCHPRMESVGQGKKEQQVETAKQRATGKFAPPPPPRSSALN